MPTLTLYSKTEKFNISFEGTPTVQQVLEASGITMPQPCGGIGICGKCAIEALGNISQPDDAERSAGCRLSCRTRLYGDAIVTLKNRENSASGLIVAEEFSESITPANCPAGSVGAAIDIGTTTVALSVYDLASGNCLASKSSLNPQSAVAADVMGRINAAVNGRLSDMQDMLVSCIRTLAEATGYFESIGKWVLTGNTTMLYLLTGRTPQTLAVAPYAADHLFGEEITFLGKPAYLPNCMHAFVGADITCAVLTSGICNSSKTALLCDIGTNGEIALWKNGKLYVTSTAAGPVFEGAGISCGCQSVPGAVETVSLQGGTLSVSTIANAAPVGICGSGVIDAIACLLANGTIEETGYMEKESFPLCKGLLITREDIRNIQLAKAAIAAGIRTLLEVTGTSAEEISVFYLAGGFGKHLNLDSAVQIGLFPAELKNKVKVLGNAALQGAAAMLTKEELKEKAAFLTKVSQHVSLGGDATFNKLYVEEMFFPRL